MVQGGAVAYSVGLFEIGIVILNLRRRKKHEKERVRQYWNSSAYRGSLSNLELQLGAFTYMRAHARTHTHTDDVPQAQGMHQAAVPLSQ
eukprot:984637-Pelagomonas_calceolata.AAC.2